MSDQPSDYQVVEPGHELRNDVYRRFESFLWKDDRVCRIGRGAFAAGTLIACVVNISLLIAILNR